MHRIRKGQFGLRRLGIHGGAAPAIWNAILGADGSAAHPTRMSAYRRFAPQPQIGPVSPGHENAQTFANEAGDEIFAPRMKTLLQRAVVLARRRMELAESTRRAYQRRRDRDLDAIMALAPTNQHGKRLRKTLRQEPKPLVHIPGPSRRTTR